MATSDDKAKVKAKAAGKKAGKAEKPAKKPAGRAPATAGGLRGYFESTRLPIHSLVFVIPFILFYEVFVLVVNRPIIATYGSGYRVTSDKFIRDAAAQALDTVGVHGAPGDPVRYGVFSGAIVILTLLVWQIVSRKPWNPQPRTLLGMLGESLVIAFVLVLLARYVVDPLLKMTIEEGGAAWLYGSKFRDCVFGVGAGVYEEFLFRLLLVWVFALIVMGTAGLDWDGSRIVAVILAAIAFAAHHHISEPFTWTAFLSRTVAGVFFGVLYYVRGFGLAVGTHAVYDIYAVFLVSEHVLPGGPG